MAAPATATTRETPLGIPLDDGYPTKIAFLKDPNISFWEKALTPPALDSGDAIETTTMWNAIWRTFASQALITLEEIVTTVAWDPDAYNEIRAIMGANSNGDISVYFPDGSTLDFFGFLRRFEPGELTQGTPPEATITIQPTNWDPTNNVEAGPVLTEVAGT